MSDFDRPLAQRGRQAAPLLGAFMHRRGHRPDIALCSPAVRAIETWALVRDGLGGGTVETIRDEIYNADPRDLLDCLCGLDDRHGSAVLIGHNPSVLILALGLAGGAVGDPFGGYPPAALAVFTFDTDRWRAVSPANANLVSFTHPDELDAGT